MRYIGTVDFQVPCQQVWEALLTPEELSICVPGLLSWRPLKSNQTFSLQLAWEAGTNPIQFPLLLEWVEQRPPEFLLLNGTMTFSNSQIVGEGEITLTAVTPTHTQLQFTAVITTPNKMTDRIRHTAMPQIITSFFKCMKTHLQTS